MMEESCETCNVPLMKSRDKKQELCVECKKNYVQGAKPVEVNKPVEVVPAHNDEGLKRLEDEKQRILKERLQGKQVHKDSKPIEATLPKP